jgi:hypothetical protein
MGFFNLAEDAYLEKNEPFSTLKTLICRKYSCQKRTIYSQVNYVMDASASNTDRFLSRDACVSSTQLTRLIWNSRAYFPQKNLSCRKYSCQKLTQFSQANNVLDAAPITQIVFIGKINVLLQLS